MPVSPESLVSVIKNNKDKKVLATKIIETNPKVLPIVPKLIQDKTSNANIETDNYNINKSILEDIYNRIKTTKQNNEHIIKLFPEIELSMQILISSILSPKKMTDIQLNYKLNKNINIDPMISSKLLEEIKNYLNLEYEIEDKLPDILREILFISGSYVQAVIPESSVDDLINSDLLASFSTENFKARADVLINKIAAPVGLLNTNVDIKIDNELVKLAIEEHTNVTDNIGIFSFNKLKSKITTNLIKDAYRKNVSISQESLDKVNYIDIFRQKSSTFVNKDVEFVKQKNETTRKSIGKPLLLNIPSEAIIPVFIPGSKSEHIGYFVLLDESGKPLSTEIKENTIDNISGILNQNTNSLTPIQKSYKNLVDSTNKNTNINELFSLYKSVLEKQLYSSIKNSLFNSDCKIGDKNDIYFLMFTRALSDQKTNLLYIPQELVIYYAFQYNEIGIGKTLLENMEILSSIRAILLFSKVMGHVKQSIDVTKVNISLDPNDPDPEKTIEQIQDSVLKLRQNFLPLGMNNPVDLLNWIQRAGLQFGYENNPLIPNVKIDFENAGLTHTLPDTGFEEDLRKQSIISLGLSPEVVDAGFTPEFATSVVTNNILLSKRILVYQNKLSAHLIKFVNTIIFNDEDLRNILRKIILESIDNIQETLTEEEKQELNKDKNNFVDNYIDLISENIDIDLPKPENTNLVNLSAEFDIYKENLEKVIDSIISTDLFSENISGELSNNIDTIKNIYKHYLLRKWCAENNFYPEAVEISSDNDEDLKNLLSVISNHLTHTMKNSSKLLNIMQKFKEAVNVDLSVIEGSGSESSTTPVSSSNDSGDDSGSGEGSSVPNDDDDDLNINF